MWRLYPYDEIHTTDAESYAQCRRKWNWQSMLRLGLQRAATPEPLMLGQGVHIGLDTYWSNDRGLHKGLDAFDTWIAARAQAVRDWSGAPLWASEKEMFRNSQRLGKMMLLHYHLWCTLFAQRYEVIATEQKFDLPFPGLDGHPIYGLSLSGRFDGVIRRRRDGALFLLEFKTSAKMHNVKWMFRGLQGSVYTWAARQMYPGIQGIMYQVLRKKIPDQPKPLKRGGFSRAKNQDTSRVFYKHCLKRIAEKTDTPLAEVEGGARDMLLRLSTEQNGFFFQTIKRKPQAQIRSAMQTLYHLAMQMTDPDIPIFAMSSWWCNNCMFKDPCELYETGGDYQALLDAEYAPRTYWEKV